LLSISYDRLFHCLFRSSLTQPPAKKIQPTNTPLQIDVRDLAFAHLAALSTAAAANQRFLIGGLPYSSQLAVDVLKTIPELKGRLPKDPETAETVPVVRMGDVDEWNRKLGLKLRTAQETFEDGARKLLELEEKLGKK
jgi:nucleoside-diphosphate-sugar epimerase